MLQQRAESWCAVGRSTCVLIAQGSGAGLHIRLLQRREWLISVPSSDRPGPLGARSDEAACDASLRHLGPRHRPARRGTGRPEHSLRALRRGRGDVEQSDVQATRARGRPYRAHPPVRRAMSTQLILQLRGAGRCRRRGRAGDRCASLAGRPDPADDEREYVLSRVGLIPEMDDDVMDEQSACRSR